MKKEEQNTQIQIVEYLSYYAKKNNFIFFSVPNEGLLKYVGNNKSDFSFATLTLLKKMGLTPGVSDLVIVKDSNVYFIELKSKNGEVSKEQSIFLNNALNAGAKTAIVRSFEQAQSTLFEWGIIEE